jgi:hypothetical protein
MQFGRYYEEFEVGAVYKHWPGRTITEYDIRTRSSSTRTMRARNLWDGGPYWTH